MTDDLNGKQGGDMNIRSLAGQFDLTDAELERALRIHGRTGAATGGSCRAEQRSATTHRHIQPCPTQKERR